MGMLIRQEEDGKLWVVEIREIWTIRGEQNYYNLAKLLKELYIDYSIQFNLMEEYIFTLDNPKWYTRDRNEFYNVLTKLLNWKAEGVGSKDTSTTCVSTSCGCPTHNYTIASSSTMTDINTMYNFDDIEMPKDRDSFLSRDLKKKSKKE